MRTAAMMMVSLAHRGIRLEADGGELVVRAPRRGILTEGLLDQIRGQKSALLAALANPKETAFEIWDAAVQDVGARWDRLFAGDEGAPWADDLELTESIGAAIRAGDLERTLELVGRWRRVWEKAMADTKETA